MERHQDALMMLEVRPTRRSVRIVVSALYASIVESPDIAPARSPAYPTIGAFLERNWWIHTRVLIAL